MNPDLLSQLRDIHSPPPPSWWPPAPGWWLLAIFILALLTWAGLRAWAVLQRRHRRRRMLAWIDNLESSIDPRVAPGTYLANLNQVFKRVAIRAFPEAHCEIMSGKAWSEFVRARLGQDVDGEQLDALASGPYAPEPGFDAAAISDAARRWIKQYG